jgi:hypothetical protein
MLSFGSGFASSKLAQFTFRHNEFRYATIQADNKVGEYPNDGLVNIFQSGGMDAHLPLELPQIDKSARSAPHPNSRREIAGHIPLLKMYVRSAPYRRHFKHGGEIL